MLCDEDKPMTKATYSPIIYPESDGQPMTESDATRDYLLYCVGVLENYFRSRTDVYVSGNLFIYYQEGNTKKTISPDVFVVFGVSQRKRRSYKTWQEGNQVPQFVLEVTSRSTRKQDEVAKPELYASLGITEYFQYDPTGDYLNPQLKGQRLVDGVYQPLDRVTNWTGHTGIHSQVLGLDLCLQPMDGSQLLGPSLLPLPLELRFYDPQSKGKLLSYQELAIARELEKQRAENEKQRADRLAEKLRSLGLDPDEIALDDDDLE
jgi:Uma2 family endonuclease